MTPITCPAWGSSSAHMKRRFVAVAGNGKGEIRRMMFRLLAVLAGAVDVALATPALVQNINFKATLSG